MNIATVHIERAQHICFTQTNNEMVLLNPLDENFYHLNGTAADLWLSLTTPKTIAELTQVLVQKYQGSSDEYQQDVIEWITDAVQKKLLSILS